MKLETVGIPSGDVILAGLRYRPGGHTKDIALLFAHGFTSGKYSMDGLAGYLAGRGYEGLTFDFVGHKLGGTGGEMHSTAQAVGNLRDAMHWFHSELPHKRIVLVGHSMGGAASLAAAAGERGNPASPLAGVVAMCIGTEPAHGFDSMVGRAMLTQREDYVAGAPALELLTELNSVVLSAGAMGAVPSLFVAARQDVLVSVERVEALASLAAPHSAVVTLDTSHLEAPDRARTTVLQWLEGKH